MPYTKGTRGRLAFGTILVLVETGFQAAGTWMFKVLTDDVLAPRDFHRFPDIAAVYLALTIAAAATTYTANMCLAAAAERFIRRVRTAAFTKALTLSPRFFAEHPPGDMMSRLDGDVAAVETLAISGVTTVVEAVSRVVIFAGLLLFIDPPLAALTALGAPLMWRLSRIISGRLSGAALRSRQARGRLLDICEQALADIPLIQAYRRERAEARRFDEAAAAAESAEVATVRVAGLAGPLVQILQMVSILVVIGGGAWRLSLGAITLGEFLVFLAYLTQIFEPVESLAQLASTAAEASASAARVAEILDAHPDVVDPVEPVDLDAGTRDLALHHVTFTYPGSDTASLRDISMEIPAGSRTAVVGPSGSGKTTLSRLLIRLHDPDEGEITLDETPLTRLRLGSVRDDITVVPQHTTLTEGGVRDALLWANPHADEALLDRVMSDAGVAPLVTQLTQGLDTSTGHHGQDLSGGQRHRVALARGLLRAAPILILDEPTAALDAHTERALMARLFGPDLDRTTVVITHRLETIQEADQIYVLDRGRIAEHGTHQGLLAQQGLYHDLWRAQHADGQHSDDEYSDDRVLLA